MDFSFIRGSQVTKIDHELDTSIKKNRFTKFTAKQCKIESVTVFNDRAEVARRLDLDVTVNDGLYEVVVEELSAEIDPQSVRISGAQGHAIILEVAYDEKLVIDEEKIKTELGELRQQAKELDHKVILLKIEHQRLANEQNFIEQLSHQFSKQKEISKEHSELDILTEDSVDGFIKFLDLHTKKLTELNIRQLQIDNDILDINKQKELINNSIQQHIAEKKETTRNY